MWRLIFAAVVHVVVSAVLVMTGGCKAASNAGVTPDLGINPDGTVRIGVEFDASKLLSK